MNAREKVFAITKLIPKGKIVNYGQIAKMVGLSAQTVGHMLSGMKEDEYGLIPWERVVAVNGHISTLKMGEKGILQKKLLIQQGYSIDNEDCVDMIKHRWEPTLDELEPIQDILALN